MLWAVIGLCWMKSQKPGSSQIGLIFQIFNPETISATFYIVQPPVIFFIECGWLENQFENKTIKQAFQNTGEILPSNACILVTQAYSWSQILPLYPNTKLNLREKSFEWSRKKTKKTKKKNPKNSCIALPGKGGCSRLTPSKLCVLAWRRVLWEVYGNGSKTAWSTHGHSSDWLVVR